MRVREWEPATESRVTCRERPAASGERRAASSDAADTSTCSNAWPSIDASVARVKAAAWTAVSCSNDVTCAEIIDVAGSGAIDDAFQGGAVGHPRHGHVHELHLTAPGCAVLIDAEVVIDAVEQEVTRVLGTDGAQQLRSQLELLTRTIGTP